MGSVNAIGYRCPVCNAVYRPSEAAALNYYCHAQLERCRTGEENVNPGEPVIYQAVTEPHDQIALQVVPPAQNEVSPAVVEQILGSLTEGPISLELAGDRDGQMMVLRGPKRIVEHARTQLEAGYGQVAFTPLSREEDPVYAGAGAVIVGESMRLRRPPYFPIRTWRQFGGIDDAGRLAETGPMLQMADPIRVLVGAMAQFAEGEWGLVQLVLRRRAPEDWADAYQGSAQQVDFRVRAASAPGQARAGILAGSILLLSLDIIFGCYAASLMMRHGMSQQALGALALLGFLVAVSAVVGYWGVHGWKALSTQLNANPDVVRQKVSEPAFYTDLRLWAWAPTPEGAERLLARLVSAYSVFNLAEGNAFVRTGCWTGHPMLIADGNGPGMILNLAEIAGIWHMPVGVLPDRMRRHMFFRRVPLDISKPSDRSVLIGGSSKSGGRVYLPYAAVESGVFIIGKPQVGKSNVMELIAVQAMADRGRAVVVIDPHQDMARRLMGLVPPERIDDVRCLDVASSDGFPGINMLDMTMGVDVDKVVSDLVTTGRALWAEYWGPRMESVLRYAAKTIALVNRERVSRGHPGQQLSVLYIPRLLLKGKREREAFLVANIGHLGDPVVQEIAWWWQEYYDEQRTALMQQVISPVITKLFHLSASEATRLIFGQPCTTLDLRRTIRERGIVLVNTGAALLGEDVGAFIGALVVNYLDSVIREQGALPRECRIPLTMVVDEFQSLSDGVNWRDFLGQLRKFGAHVVLGTQSLAGMREDNREMPGEILAGVMTVLVFQVNAEDAQYLQYELDQSVPVASMINLPPYHCYLKTIAPDRQRLSTVELRVLPPLGIDLSVAEQVRKNMMLYSHTAQEIAAMREVSEPFDEIDQVWAERTRMLAELEDSRKLVPQDQLLSAAMAAGTRSSQNYGSRSGSIGRGQKVRPGRADHGSVARGFGVKG